MGDSANEFAVLDNGRAAHPLHDTAGCFQKCGIGHPQQQITPAVLKELLATLALHRTPAGKDALSDYRLHIDTIDSRIIELLAERMDVARAIGDYKRKHDMAVVQHDRYNELLLAAEAKAEAMSISKQFIHQIFSAIHEESVRQQLEVREEEKKR